MVSAEKLRSCTILPQKNSGFTVGPILLGIKDTHHQALAEQLGRSNQVEVDSNIGSKRGENGNRHALPNKVACDLIHRNANIHIYVVRNGQIRCISMYVCRGSSAEKEIPGRQSVYYQVSFYEPSSEPNP